MGSLDVRLFGRFGVYRHGQALRGFDSGKGQELLSYLLLSSGRPRPREGLAALLWPDQPTARSRKYLRQVLWQLQAAFEGDGGVGVMPVVQVETEWVGLNPEGDIDCDAVTFEHAYDGARGRAGQDLDVDQVRALRQAVDLYHGDLLEGWYQDWCVSERERLQLMLLRMLGSLAAYGEARCDYEEAIAYASQILRYDPAHEGTHQRLMRLHYLAGDRAGALRQYRRCSAALHDELGVQPSHRTLALYEQIRSDRLDGNPGRSHPAPPPRLESISPPPTSLVVFLDRLRDLRSMMVEVESRLDSSIRAVELALDDRGEVGTLRQ